MLHHRLLLLYPSCPFCEQLLISQLKGLHSYIAVSLTQHHYATPKDTTSTSVGITLATMSKALTEASQPLNKDGSRRKSRVLRRKTDHSVIERRRREKINEKLVALQNIVPACRKECQDLIERKFAAPLQDSQDGGAGSVPATKKISKRKREEEKLDKAKKDMSEKIKSSMVLEKLCIISHTLDFVARLQEENKALRAKCDCQAGSSESRASEVELEEHYRNAHSYETSQDFDLPHHSGTSDTDRDLKRPSLSLSSSDSGGLQQDNEVRPAKRRLHWGSDDVREAPIRSDVCYHGCDAVSIKHMRQCEPVSAGKEDRTAASSSHVVGKPLRRESLTESSDAEIVPARPFPQARHSCCRDEEQSSEGSSDGSDEPASPPPYTVRWPSISTGPRPAYFDRRPLPSIANLDLPKQKLRLSSVRHDTVAWLYRKDLSGAPETSSSRPFRPLSLYTSHAPPSTLPSTKP